MRLLHTSDWHVGKAIRGHSRADEHRAVLAEIASIAGEHEVDLVVVAGDLFETAAPSAEAEQIVYRALLDLAGTGAEVAVIAGNHDNARRLRAVTPLLELGRVHVVTQPRAADEGGVRTVPTASGGPLQLVALPFVSQRGIVRSEQLMEQAAYEHAQDYAERLQLLIHTLVDACDPEVPTVVAAHAFVRGGAPGGGERLAHLVEEYAVAAQSFPASVAYVALGHLHRPQKLPGGPAIHYCGSPLQLDFGEEDEAKQVNLVELAPGAPGRGHAGAAHLGTAAAHGGRDAGRAAPGGRPRRRRLAAGRRCASRPGPAWPTRCATCWASRWSTCRSSSATPTRRGAAGPGRARRPRSCSPSSWPSATSTTPGSEALFADLYDELHQGAEA